MQDRIDQITEIINEFIVSRDWDKFHTPKSLAMSIAIEAAEIMELFQWSGNEESRTLIQDPEKIDALKDEIADVAIYLFSLARVSKINIIESIKEKMRKNENRFPREQK